MSQSLVSCPLCCQPTFSSTNALCLSLISIVSKCLNCPLCEEVLRGLDKLTIHLLSHLLTQTTTNNNGYNYICQENKYNSFNSVVKPFENSNRQCTIKKGEQDNNVVGSTMITSDKVRPPGLVVDDQVMLLFHSPSTSRNHSINNCEITSKGEGTSDTYNFQQATSSLQTTDIPSTQLDKQDKGYSKQSSGTVYKTERVITQSHKNYDNVIQHCSPYITDTITSGSLNNTENRTEFRDSATSLLDKMYKNYVFSDFEKFYINWKHKAKFLKSEPRKGEGTPISKPSDYCNNADRENIHNTDTDQGMTKSIVERENKTEVFCKVCSLHFPDSATLSLHESIAHSGVNTSENGNRKLYECQLCSKAFKMRGSLMVHTRVAHSPGSVAAIAKLVESKQDRDSATSNSCGSAPESPQFNCSTCGKTFKKEYHLVQHEKTHEGKQWECDICLKSFTTKYFLKKHKRLHTGEMPYVCTICNKSFTFQQSYHKHLLYHNDDKPYSCCDCGRAFKELSTLHNHQRIHTGEKPFSCEHCSKCFRQRVSYLVHRRIHTGVMPYKCLECNKSFRYKVSERTHKCTGQLGVSSVKPSSELKDLPHNQIMTEGSASLSSDQPHLNSNSGSTVNISQNTSSVYDVNSSETSKDGKGILWKNSEVISLPDTTDFFSLVMSPSTSEKLQNLTLSADSNRKSDSHSIGQESTPDHIMESVNDDESLKDLLYSVSDY